MNEHVRTAWLLVVRRPGLLALLCFVPLYSLVFFTAVRHGTDPRLAAPVALTAFLMTMWSHAVFVASEAIDHDRAEGMLETLLAAPGSYTRSLLLRITATATLCLPAAAEITLIGTLGFGFPLRLAAPGVFLAALALTFAGTTGTAALLAGLFVLVRGARTYQNALTYPCYLLGGLIVPAALLPQPLAALSRVWFLSWGADLMRDALDGDPAGALRRLLALTALAGLQCLLGVLVLHRVLARAREGSVALHA
ncbi:ABC transporter permease [Kitasatospora sp. NPDC048540]|uniref:ABC transporter permease n=1 Tax=unclassified Kitasatospora TaxID=2633591 RepID=UPI000539D582|nr:ABC transporter permease [Kitasatospora sp. MBT63]